ncbi:hypothetical protein AB0911_35895 [Streptomyces nigra]|uniref:hypothetical protein n=1 Tax=Streptomyces nigra TaxID=1827580 RepID=UPI003452A5FC
MHVPNAPEDSFLVITLRTGATFVNGARIRGEGGQTTSEAVLDRLHDEARQAGRPVRGLLENRQEEFTAVIEVRPDGSSTLLHSQHMRAEDDLPEPDGDAPTTLQEPQQDFRGGPAERSSPVPDVRVSASDPGEGEGRQREPGPDHGQAVKAPPAVRVPDLPPSPSRPPAAPAPDHAPTKTLAVTDDGRAVIEVPAVLTRKVRRVNEAVAAGALREAAALAAHLHTEVAGSHGPQHPYTLETAGMRAYTHHLLGEHQEALALLVALAEAKLEGADPNAARDELVRAVLAWKEVADSAAATDFAERLSTAFARFSQQSRTSHGR